jgi:hypothetical protein
MNDSKKQFVDRLIAAEPPSLDARQRYDKEIRAMLEKTLTPRERGVYLVSAVILVLLGALLVLPPLMGPEYPEGEFVKFIVAYFMVTAFAFAILAGLFFRTYWTGVIFHRTSRQWAAGLGVAYVGILGLLFLGAARHTPEILRDEVRIFGLLLVVYAAVAWMRHGVAQAESRTAEKLLEIELRLAEMGPHTSQPQSQIASTPSQSQP